MTSHVKLATQMPFDELIDQPVNCATILKNETCVYCGCLLPRAIKTKEHVIGRRFVPKGKLYGTWNLIVNACKPCNGQKADLEDDLSAISMQPDSWGQFASPDPLLASEGARKAVSKSRRTGKEVAVSDENVVISGNFGSAATFSASFISPPQADRNRVFELARLQLVALFYWVTYRPVDNRGGYWRGTFVPMSHSCRRDWGNSLHRTFMKSVLDWKPCLIAIAADGFFKAVIRWCPSTICWSWALEWNHNHRIIGFFGEKTSIETALRTLTQPEMYPMAQSPGERWSMREEIALPDNQDQMFLC